ncbi:MAG: hypothetical protein ABIR96_04520 [Bdellovibrionota bacterium]
MKNYLAIFTGSPQSSSGTKWEAMNAAARAKAEAAGMKGWQEWAEKNHASLVQMGAPLGKTKRVGPEGVSDITNAMCAYAVVQASSHDAAAKLFLNHPHFAIFPGDGVEIMECLAIPGMLEKKS